ncbi:hypothetical protein ACJJTC_017407 [Scirpophaga incertulas]
MVVIALAVAASGMEYPPGVNPITCPDYPFCQHEMIPIVEPVIDYHVPEPAPLAMPVPEWVRNPSILPVAPVDPAHVVEVIPVDHMRYPAGFDPVLCPNYPYCF